MFQVWHQLNEDLPVLKGEYKMLYTAEYYLEEFGKRIPFPEKSVFWFWIKDTEEENKCSK